MANEHSTRGDSHSKRVREHGERCKVADLSRGEVWPAVIASYDGGFYIVKRDSDRCYYRVNEGFVTDADE